MKYPKTSTSGHIVFLVKARHAIVDGTRSFFREWIHYESYKTRLANPINLSFPSARWGSECGEFPPRALTKREFLSRTERGPYPTGQLPLEDKDANPNTKSIGKLRSYVRAVDPTMLHAMGGISPNPARGTEATLADAAVHLPNHHAAHACKNTEAICRASGMALV